MEEARIDETNPRPSIRRPLEMVRPPYPPGSSTSISPLAAVFAYAPANVLHGAERLQGLASLPTPETHVRVACANNDEAVIKINIAGTRRMRSMAISFSLSDAESRSTLPPEYGRRPAGYNRPVHVLFRPRGRGDARPHSCPDPVVRVEGTAAS